MQSAVEEMLVPDNFSEKRFWDLPEEPRNNKIMMPMCKQQAMPKQQYMAKNVPRVVLPPQPGHLNMHQEPDTEYQFEDEQGYYQAGEESQPYHSIIDSMEEQQQQMQEQWDAELAAKSAREEEMRRKAVEHKQRIEEQKQKLAEANRKRLEEQKQRVEDQRRQLEEQRLQQEE